MFGLSVKRAPSAVSILFSFVCFGLLLVAPNRQAWFGVSETQAGQASSPDLVVSSISNPPATAVAGAVAISITDTTGNAGDGTANPSTTRYRLSVDTTITSADPLLPVTRSIPTLKKNSSSTGTVVATIPANFTPGIYYLAACADDTAVITETNETNNCRVSTSTVQIYPPTSLTATPTSVSAGGSVTATWTQIPAPTSTDWIGLYVPGTSNSAYITYIYVGCSSTPTVAVPAGSCPFSIPFWVTPGTYEFRLQWNGGFSTIATSNTFAVIPPPPPAKLAITSVNGGANPTAGSGFPVTVQVQDVNGTPTIVSTATNVSLSRKTGTGTLGGTLTGTISANSGQVTISGAAYTKAESGVVLTATQTSGVSLTAGDSAPFTVNAGAPAVLSFTTQPGSATVGASFPGPPTVIVRDSLGNNVTSPTSVTVTLGNNAVGAVLSGTTNKNTSAGIASFNDLSVNKSSNGYTLIASSAGLTSVTSSPFLVSPATATALAFLTQPTNATTSSAIPGPPTVVVRDSQGNTVTNSSAAITTAISANPGGGILSGTTVKNASGGVASFADLKINQAANGYTLTATSPGLTGATTAAFNVSAGGGAAGSVTRTPGGGAITGALVEALQSGVVKGTGSTNSSGNYSITGLSPGSYDVRGTAGGFTSQTQTSVPVTAGATATVNFSLAVTTPTAGIVYIYDELQRLKSVIDPVGESASYAYDAVGNLLSITRNNASQTSIIDFNPNGSPVGSGVTIYGTGYNATSSQNSVTFNGVAATVISSTLTRIVTTVPAGATTGPIAVTTPAGGAISSTNFNVTGSPVGAPTLASFTPAIGVPGTAVTITGTNFDTTQTNDEVRFSPALATVSTATTTSISTTVPVGARSGKLSVSTPNGTAISTQDFFVPPSGLTANDVDFTSRITIGGPALVMTVNTANKVAVALFEGIAGQRVSIKVSNSTFPDTGPFTSTAFLTILKPDGFQFGASYGWHSPDGSINTSGLTSPNFLDVQTLPMTGTYTLILDPNGTNTGQATITVYDIPPDLQGPIVPGGAPVNVVTTIPGQNRSFTFAGTQGQIVSVNVTNSTYPDLGAFTTSATMNLLKPDGSVLTSIAWHSPNGSLYQASTTSDNFLNAVTLPTTGTYTLQVDPNWTHVGQATLTLYDVPAENQGTIAVDGAPVTVSTTVPGQNARLTFAANANQVVTVRVDNSTYPNLGSFTSSAILNLIKPDGTVQGWTSWNETTGNYLIAQTLVAAGTYTLQVDPTWTHTGQARVTLYDVADIAGTIVPGGSPVTVTTTIPGQNAKLTFSGTAGQRVSLQMTGVTMGFAQVAVNNPTLGALVANQKYDIKMEYFDGSGAAQAQLRWSSPSTAEQIIPSSSLYLPGGITVGGLQGDYFNNTLSGAPALTRTDSTVNFTWSGSPGAGVTSDNFEARWTGQVQAQFSETYQFCTITDDGVRVWINDVPVIDQWVNQGAITSCTGAPISMGNAGVGPGGGFINPITLPVTGTYSITIDPSGSSTGQMILTLYDVPADPTASITIGGSPVTVTTTTPGQNAKLTFSGTAGQRVNLQMTGVTMPWALVTMANPTLGALVANQKYDVKMEYFDNGGDAQAHLLWNSPSTPEQAIPSSKLYLPGGVTVGGLQGDYFNNTALSGAPALSRTDSAVDFSWSGSPGPGVASDSFAVRWTGQVQAQLSESYQLCTVTDDGVRLWINDLPVIDKWPAQGPVKWCTGIPVNLANTAGIGTGGGSITNVLLPVTGTYSIVVDPDAAGGGSMTLTLVTAP